VNSTLKQAIIAVLTIVLQGILAPIKFFKEKPE